jgi:hypothetical protein
MSEAKKTFLLPCEGCAHEIDIVAGQAGSRVECPSCQRWAEVPTFRELSRLRLKTLAASGRQRSWGMPQAVALAGLACAVLAWGTAAGLGSPPKSALNHDAIREIIRSNDDASLYKALEYYLTADVARTAAPQEAWVQSRSQFLNGITRTLYALGGLGAIAAAISGLTMLMKPKDR